MCKLISVIVPVYNVEEYLPKCLESIIGQTYKRLEIILVDDGSTDNSGYICDSYARKDSRVIVIHQSNFGVSAARNEGIKIATGDYICFVDSDDWIEEDYFELIIQDLVDNNPICLINNYVKYYEKGNVKNPYSNVTQKLIMDAETALIELFKHNLYGWEPVASFYRTKALKYVKFDEDIHFGEDLMFNYNFFKVNSGCVVYLDLAKYHYVFRENSTCNSSTMAKRMDFIKVLDRILNNESGILKKLFFEKIYCQGLVGSCRFALCSENKEDRFIAGRIKEKLRDLFVCIVSNKDISLLVKSKLVVCMCPNSVVRMAYKIYKSVQDMEFYR